MVDINEVRFSASTPTSGTNPTATYSDAVNGEILKVEWKTNTTGSIFLNVSGTNETLWSNIAPSGTTIQTAYPRVYSVNNVNTTGSPQIATTETVLSPIAWLGSGWDGGSVVHLVLQYD